MRRAAQLLLPALYVAAAREADAAEAARLGAEEVPRKPDERDPQKC